MSKWGWGVRVSDPQCPVHEYGPGDYASWFDWAEKKAETHRQRKCKVCKLWVIWETR